MAQARSFRSLRHPGLPTFKFFRDSAEDDLPIVGADAIGLEARIDEMIA